MTSKSSLAAKRAIQEMGASLFYAKLRGEDVVPYVNLSSEENIASNGKLDSQDKVSGLEKLSSEKNFSDEERSSNEETIASDKTLAANETIGSKETLSSDEEVSSEESFSGYRNLSRVKRLNGNEKLSSKENLAGYENLAVSEKLAGKVELSSSENFDSKVKRTGEEKVTGRMPLSYESPLLAFITELGLSGACIAIVLRHLLPADGGRIRIGALSRSLNMSSNNIRLHLETLQTKGVIASSNGDQQGRMIKFLHPFLRSQCGVDFFPESTDGDFHQRLGEQAH